MSDRRNFSRLEFDFDAWVEYENKVYRAQVLDLALKGALLEIELLPCPLLASCLLKISLSPEVLITFKSQLVHVEDNNYGFVFQEEDLRSMIHLRRLLELNADNPQQIKSELSFLAKE